MNTGHRLAGRKILGFLLLLLPLSVVTACTSVMDFMPKPIRDAEPSSIDGAKALEAAHPDASHTYTTGNSRTIHYVELSHSAPSRPLVIFVHGSPGLWRSWIQYLNDPELQARATLIAMDRPGFGGSGSGEIERGFLQQSEDLEPLLDHAQPGQRVILVGNALGAAVVTRIAMTYPDKVTDLVLLAAPLTPSLQTESWFQYAADVPPVSWFLPKEIVVFNREYLELEKQLTEMLPLWPNVSQRVSLLLGEDDKEVPISTAAFAEGRLINAASVNIVRLPHTQHFIAWTRFDLVKAEILAHLAAPATR